jgi:hypothetical protein
MTFLFPVKNQQGTMEGRPSAPARVSMFRRLMVRVTPAERLVGDGKERDKDEKPAASGGAGAEADVGSVALDKMVISFMEDSSAAVERPPRGRCSNCFNGNQDGSDDEDFDFLPSATAPAAPPAAAGDALELLKVPSFVRIWFLSPPKSLAVEWSRTDFHFFLSPLPFLLAGPGAVREHGGAEPPGGRVADRRALRQGLRLRAEEGGHPPRRSGRAPRARVRRGGVHVAVG